MALVNAYCTLEELRNEVGTNGQSLGSAYDSQLETAANSASRQIDGFTGRRFWQDANVATREYYADNNQDCFTDDISTTTGLIVKVDDDDDGTFETTLTISTNFVVLPLNAARRTPVWPYTQVRVVDTSGAARFPVHNSGRPGVQITAKFGWPAVPDDVRKACIIQATQLFKANNAIFGGLSFGDAGFMRVRGTLNPMAEGLLEPYRTGLVA